MAADYTLVKAVSTRIHTDGRLVRGAPQEAAWSSALPAPADRCRQDLGAAVATHRSSWVRRIETPRGTVYLKTYEYRSWADRLRNLGKWTAPGRSSRAAREFDALSWLRGHGLPAPEPIAAHEWRTFGFLRRTTLVTAAFPGESVATLLPNLPNDDRDALARAIGGLVAHLHRLGFRDRNLDTRNLVAHRGRDGRWVVAKIDSPRHRLLHAGAANDHLARADWDRLLPQLAPFGVDQVARNAAP
ncbi:MAG: phosphotransferase [Planctomycetes bacterium]|nr:phosphotransferase [Planctomycetota bacterium]